MTENERSNRSCYESFVLLNVLHSLVIADRPNLIYFWISKIRTNRNYKLFILSLRTFSNILRKHQSHEYFQLRVSLITNTHCESLRKRLTRKMTIASFNPLFRLTCQVEWIRTIGIALLCRGSYYSNVVNFSEFPDIAYE